MADVSSYVKAALSRSPRRGALRREAVVATLVARNRAMTRRVGELGALDVRSRVHAELLRLARPDREDPKRAIMDGNGGGAGRLVGASRRAIVLRLTSLRWLATPISSPARAA